MRITQWKRLSDGRLDRRIGHLATVIAPAGEEFSLTFYYLDAIMELPFRFPTEKAARDWVGKALGEKEDTGAIS